MNDNKKLINVYQTDDLLPHSEDRYNRMLENLKEEFLFFTHDTDKNFFLLSPSVKNILGYTQDEYKKNVDSVWTNHPVNEDGRRHTQFKPGRGKAASL